MLYSVLSILCIALLLAITAGCLMSIFQKNGKSAVDFIRQFKKGNCIVVYLSAIPIYWIGYVYAGNHIILSLVSAVKNAVNLVAWKYDLSVISALMRDNVFYAFAVLFCYALAASNTVLFIVSILHQNIWEWCQARAWEISRKEKLLLVGNNEENLRIYSSQKEINEAYKKMKFKEKKDSTLKIKAPMILDEFSSDEKTAFYAERVNFTSQKRGNLSSNGKESDKGNLLAKQSGVEKYCLSVLKKSLKKRQGKCIIVVNMKDDADNISLCRAIIDCISEFLKENEKTESVVSILERIRIYVFGNPEYETIYDTISDLSKGSIRYVNKYRQISMDFIDKYPLTQFMTDAQIDYESSLISPDVDVNVALIGFGKTNRQLFLTSVTNNQFLTEIDGKMAIKPVHYYAFDNRNPKNDKNFNHSYRRFENEFKAEIEIQKASPEKSPYLPLPDLPSDVHYEHLDINDGEFYTRIKRILSGSKKFNYVIIAFGSDLENIDMAHKMVEKKQEWGLSDTYIFVKVRDNKHKYKIFSEKKAFVIGNECESVYHIDFIDDDRILTMAKMRNRIYDLEAEIEKRRKDVESLKIENKDERDKALSDAVNKIDTAGVYSEADYKWYVKKEEIERESNIYACLSLRSKLHLMGLDYCHKNEKPNALPLDNDAYLSLYAQTDMPEFYEDVLADGKKIVKYNLNFRESRRKTMAIHEHMRWNSYMLTKGLVPASKEMILNDKDKNGKNYVLRHHGNITSFDGLVEYRQMLARRDGESEENYEKIKYDYQLLDDAHWLLGRNNYKIIKKESWS